MGSFPFMSPSFVGAHYSHPQTQVLYFYIMIYYVVAPVLQLGDAKCGGGGGRTNRKDPTDIRQMETTR